MRNIHAFVNPFSGVAGGSLEIWGNLKKVFTIAHVQVTETMTTHQGHAEEVCNTINLEEVRDGIIVVSGDGLFHEVVNGLLHRPDWEQASKIPLGIVPAGSGNGLARSIQSWNPYQAALAIIKGKTEPLDTWSVIANQDRRFAVLSIEWGTIASIDFDSERVRFLGGARFHLWSFLKLVNRQRYTATLSFLRGNESSEHAPRLRALQASMQQEQLLRAIEKVNLKYGSEAAAKFAASSPPLSPKASLADLPLAERADYSPRVQHANERNSPSSSSAPSTHSPASSDPEQASSQASSPTIDDSTNAQQTEEENAGNLNAADQAATVMPDIGDMDLNTLVGPPLKFLNGARTEAEGWETVSADWMMILALNTTHMAHNVQAAPQANISDGLIDILTISKASRRTLLRMILAMENGSHMSDPDLSYIKASAFVLKPTVNDDKHRLHGIDGEKCECDGVLVEVHPRLLTIFCDPDALTDAALSNPHSYMSKELQKLNAQLIEEMKKEVAQFPADDPESASPSSSPAASLDSDSPPSAKILDPTTLQETASSSSPLPVHYKLEDGAVNEPNAKENISSDSSSAPEAETPTSAPEPESGS